MTDRALLTVCVLVALAATTTHAQISRLPETLREALPANNQAQTFELFAPLLAAAPKDGVSVTYDLAYGPEPQQKLDVYRPTGGTNLPVLVYVHGGALTSGDKNETKEISANVLYYFARRGFVGINANYRLAPAFKYPSAAQDMGGVVAWAQRNASRYGGNAQRIYMVGRSSGALHVATWAFDPRVHGASGPGLAGVVLISGRLKADNRRDDPVGARVEDYFGTDTSLYADRSPVNFGAGSALPTFMVIAEFDNRFVDVYTAELFAKMCATRSRCPRFLRMAGHNHQSTTASIGTADDQLGQEILDFIRQGR